MTPIPFAEYVNVRIRGAQSRLFARPIYEDLLAGDNLGAITTYLLNNPEYRPDIEEALERLPEREGLEFGVTACFARRVAELRSMTAGALRELFDMVLYSFDLKNLRTIVLAHVRGTSSDRVRSILVPCGAITLDRLDALMTTPDLHGLAVELKHTFPLGASALETALREHGDHEPASALINRMERSMYHRILDQLTGDRNGRGLLRGIYRLEIDLRNITAVLKHLWEGLLPGQQHFTPYIRGGTVSTQFLESMTTVQSLDEAFELLEQTPFHEAVEKGIIYYAETGFLHEMERFFEEVFIRKTQTFRRMHPFGISVFIGYVWSHYVEMTNLRAIINGIAFKTGAGQIRKGLIYA